MEPLAFIEIVDRHKDVLARHPVYEWPARIGRGYQADVIVDDPFVAPVHLTVEPAGTERFTVADAGSVNGMFLSDSGQRVISAKVGPDELVRLGHTWIRIRTSAYAVPGERPYRATAIYRRPAALLATAALMIALFLWNAWIMTSDDNDKYAMLFPTVGLVILVAIWISAWTFVSSAIGRRPHFAAHGFVACAGVIALVASESFFDYLSFGFDTGWMQYIGGVVTATIFSYVVYSHLRLNSRATHKSLVLASTGISVTLCGAIAGLSLVIDLSQDGNQRYNDLIKGPAFLFVSGMAPDTFLSDAEALKRRVDAMEKRK